MTTNMVWRSTKPSAGVEVGFSEEATERMWLLPKISFPKDGEIFKPADPQSSTFMSPYWLVPKAKDSCRANLEPHQDIVQVALGDEAPVPCCVPTLTNPCALARGTRLYLAPEIAPSPKRSRHEHVA